MPVIRGCVVMLAAVLLASCASFSEEECQFSDWAVLGERDGVNGATLDRYQFYVRECGRYGIEPDVDAYRAGRQIGLRSFCTPGGVYAAGLRGQGAPELCGNAPELVRIHRVTSAYSRAERNLSQARRELESAFDRLAFERSDLRSIRRRLNRDDLTEKQREEARADLRRSLDAIEFYERRLFELQFLLRDRERDLSLALSELIALEFELGFEPTRRRY